MGEAGVPPILHFDGAENSQDLVGWREKGARAQLQERGQAALWPLPGAAHGAYPVSAQVLKSGILDTQCAAKISIISPKSRRREKNPLRVPTVALLP